MSCACRSGVRCEVAGQERGRSQSVGRLGVFSGELASVLSDPGSGCGRWPEGQDRARRVTVDSGLLRPTPGGVRAMQLEDRDYFTDRIVLKDPYDYFAELYSKDPIYQPKIRDVMFVTG